MAKNLTFSGGKELERALLELTTKSAQKVGRFALRKAANPIAKKARAIVRKKEGRLSKAIKVRVDTGRFDWAKRKKVDQDQLNAVVYVSNKGADYRPRNSNRKTHVKGMLTKRQTDYQIGSLPKIYGHFIEYGRHKQGIPAYPFLRPAWDSEGGLTAQNRIADELRTGLAKEARRLGR